jgi:dimethylaniline monooxygenase (N-oxide forming)
MGLLEEALKSGKSTSNKILHDLSIANRSQPQPTLNALVVGAGPSGLVAAKYLLESEDPLYNVTVLEQSHSIGGTFVNKVYDGCRLVSSKYLTAFSDYRMPEDTDLLPDHPSAESYVEYLESYAKEFGLNEHIHFGCQVVSLKCMGDQTSKGSDVEGYRVQYKTTDGKTVSMHFDAVAVCSGLHNVPHVPKLFERKGEFVSKFKGDVFHSTKYQDASVFDNKRVLILG